MELEKFFEIGLPKWPACVIQGNDVTRQQAQEILIRTDNWNPSSNDVAWKAQVLQLAGIKLNGRFQCWDSTEEFLRRHHVLELHFLRNEQISSCYIGGPHGWCSWDGKIGKYSGNIGKWPSVERVYKEWKLIAEAFPFLNLRCQIFDKEDCDEAPKALVEFVVTAGTVQIMEPKTNMIPVDDLQESLMRLNDRYRERGCTPAMLAESLQLVRGKVIG